jgi:hypothetical protein
VAQNIGKLAAQAVLDATPFTGGIKKMTDSARAAAPAVASSMSKLQTSIRASLDSIKSSLAALSFGAVLGHINRFVGMYSNALRRVREIGERQGATPDQQALSQAAAQQEGFWSRYRDFWSEQAVRGGSAIGGGAMDVLGMMGIGGGLRMELDRIQRENQQRLARARMRPTRVVGFATEEERRALGQMFGPVQGEHRQQARSALELLNQLNETHSRFGETSTQSLERQLRQWPQITRAMRETILEQHRMNEAQEQGARRAQEFISRLNQLKEQARSPLDRVRDDVRNAMQRGLTPDQQARLIGQSLQGIMSELSRPQLAGGLRAGSAEAITAANERRLGRADPIERVRQALDILNQRHTQELDELRQIRAAIVGGQLKDVLGGVGVN